MSLLPSPVPHPLDHSPWDLPGWMYEALDWVVGVEWPEGNERAVWDLADQWYAVAAALAGPQADAMAAAAEVRSGYGGIGAVAEAFDAAWRRVAEGDEAPLPILLAVSTDLGRLVEECGCDIEGAKLEVWIELGILVVELLSVAVAAALTAGAASPAAGAAITASRLIVQQIFKRLTAQLARKSLQHGLREAGERAAKQVTEAGVRGLARRAAVGGLTEAGEETGVSLATQAYQTSTGRRHGLDLTDLGASAVGGLAGGAAAPLAGLGRHAGGWPARAGEHLGREMVGEVIAENAAGLATGQGLTSLEDAARAAVSGGAGSATAQADTALRARLDGQLAALGDTALSSTNLTPGPAAQPGRPSAGLPDLDVPQPRPAAEAPESDATGRPEPLAGAGSAGGLAGATLPADSGPARTAPTVSTEPSTLGPPAANVIDTGRPAPTSADVALSGSTPVTAAIAAPESGLAPGGAASVPCPASVGGTVSVPGPAAAGGTVPVLGPVPAGGAVSVEPLASAPAVSTPVAAPPAAVPVPATAPGPTPAPAAPAVPTPGLPAAVNTGAPIAPPPWASSIAPPAVTDRVDRLPPGRPAADAAATAPAPSAPSPQPLRPVPPAPPVPSVPPLPPVPPVPPVSPVSPVEAVAPGLVGTEGLRPRTPEWYAAVWAADRDAFERRRYRGHFEHQRTNYEAKLRRDRAAELRVAADRSYDGARWLIGQGRAMARAARNADAERLFQEGRRRERRRHQQLDLAKAALAGAAAPTVVGVSEPDFREINDDVGDLAPGAVETVDRSALTGDDHPPPIDRTRSYGRPGGLRPPLKLHQTDVERRMPREPDGRVTRTADPRRGGWFRLMNDGGPAADPTRGINCVDCTLSLFDTWMHGRPRVAAPRTFDAYAAGDITRPLNGEQHGTRRIEDVTGGRFQRLCEPGADAQPAQRRHAVDHGYRNLHDQLLLGGHGSYAFVVNTWEGGGSHIWVAVNQNGSVLYLDPQTGRIASQPIYRHTGAPYPYNVVDVDILVLGPDGRPMPMSGLRRGRFSVRPDLPEYPPATEHEGYGEPYLNRMHLIAGPGSAAGAGDVPVGAILAGCPDLNAAFATGVAPNELAAVLDAPTLLRLVPRLDELAARDLATFFADPRVREMLDESQRRPPTEEPQLAEKLVRQVVERPDLARMILATPELLNSLTARPLTLYHLSSHQQAIDVLGEVLDDIAVRGAEAVAAEGPPSPRPTPLTEEQRRISRSVAVKPAGVLQQGFDRDRRADASYRGRYLDNLYLDAAAAQVDLNQLAIALAHVDGVQVGQPGWRKQPKDRRRAEDKVNKYQGDASRLLDLAAAKVEFRSLDHLYAALARVRDHPDLAIVAFEDRFVELQGSGYRDVQLILKMRNGHLAEFRLHLATLDEVAVWEHSLFEVRRDLESLARAEGRPLTPEERAIADGILRQEQELFWRALLATYEENG
ncbi:toxin glutamine deamidase domain-containing protein [Micromonospora sp. NPDC048909]|uniref:toxin glutamine deamidase domain-containing protein n=1 Tax=Micromonospora sp. NPDC048909 TaxID=3155643 RepID=UPI0033C0ED05